jgi:alkanesulfonate monooxygenase SsuD/methylene tetrahydromethanopterin reductase-like flavin-dependent oxidoreductase (luciferase family)
MIKFHWIVKDELNVKELKTFIEDLDTIGYESALFVFGPNVSDNLILVSHVLKDSQKIKLMFAMRPNSLTAKYASNIISAYEQIAPGRLVLNIVAGTYEKDEILFNSNLNIEERKQYAGKFVKQVREYSNVKNFPKIVFSGFSEKTIENTEKHGDTVLAHLGDYVNYPQAFINLNKEKMVRAWISIGDTEKSAKEKLFELTQDEKVIGNTLCGTYESILLEIDHLESLGVTDILVSEFKGTTKDQVHNLFHKYLSKSLVAK